MFKILIILILVGYVFHKITSFLFKGMFKGFSNRDKFGGQQYTNGSSRGARTGDLNVDNVPNSQSKRGNGFDGGEYVDYEEVK